MVATATYLTDSALFIRDALLSNVTDPISSSRAGGEKFVMTSYPKRNVRYPIITVLVHGASNSVRLGLRSEEMLVRIPFEIRIWARDYKEKDNLTQLTQNALRSIQLDAGSGTVANEMFGYKIISSTDVDEIDGDGSGIAVKSKIISGEYFEILA